MLILFIMLAGVLDADDATPKARSNQAVNEPNLITFSKIDKAWSYSRGENIKVAVCDWLFDTSPKASAKYIDPTSMVPGAEVGSDEPWHGEWMAQIIHQVAPGAKIIPLRARPDREDKREKDGRYPYEKYLIQGIRFAADHGAVAVTNSMGPVTQCKELQEAIDYAEQKGTLFIDVHPESKTNPNTLDKRIVHPGLVSVPQHRARPEPGRIIYVWPYEMDPVFRDGWGYSNGPPIVAGVIALMKGANPKLTPAQIRSILVETADNRDGFAVLNAEAAVKKARDSRD
jgi:subtilisin family serine protease